MYNTGLKHKQDNKKTLDFAAAQAEQREQAKTLVEKKDTALKLKTAGKQVNEIAELTGLSVEEIEGL